MKIGSREKLYIAIVVLLLGILSLKSIYFDEIKASSSEEEILIENVYSALDEKYDNFLYESGILTFRVTSLKELSEEDVVFYRAKTRKYFLQILPIQELRVDVKK